MGTCKRHKRVILLDEASIRKIKKKHRLCKARNQLRKMTINLKKQFEMRLASESKSNPKAIWKYINSKTKTRDIVHELNVDPDDTTYRLTKSDREKADVQGRFFSYVFTVEPNGDIPSIQLCDLIDRVSVSLKVVSKTNWTNSILTNIVARIEFTPGFYANSQLFYVYPWPNYLITL